jgi:hypothetical protein
MPGTAQTIYINLHAARERARLTFDYNGPVTLGAPIGGGRYHDTLSAPGAGDIAIAGTAGNDVTFAAAQYYDGSTTIAKGATLRLGSGSAGGDGGLWTGGSLDHVVDNGSLVVRNARRPTTLPAVSGTGTLAQSGTAPTTVTSVTYTGATTVTRGRLILSGTSLRTSSGVHLTGPSAVLDLSGADDTALRGLDVAKGAKIVLRKSSGTLTVGSSAATLSGGEVTIGKARFSITRTTDRTVLTALTSTPTAAPRTASTANGSALAAPTSSGPAGPHTSAPAATGSMASTGNSLPSLWTAGWLAALALTGAGALAFARSRVRRSAHRHRR